MRRVTIGRWGEERTMRENATKLVKSKASGRASKPLKRPLWKRLMLWGLIAALLSCAAAIIGFWSIVFYLDGQTPTILSADDYARVAKQGTKIYAIDGRLVGEFFVERRTVVPAKQIPRVMKQAIVSAEDGNFYNHEGLDYWSMARAFLAVIRSRKFSQGGSTITMQVARTFYLSRTKTISRKLKEIVLSRKLEQRLGKDTILYLYLNQIYYGHGRYGVQEASRFFFSKDAQHLTVPEAALLAGLVQSPERLSPIRHPKRALARRAYVLQQMWKRDYITEERYRSLSKSPLGLRIARLDGFVAPYYVNIVAGKLQRRFGKRVLYEGGLRVYTALDPTAQIAARNALRRGLEAIDKKHQFQRPLRHLTVNAIGEFVRTLRSEFPKKHLSSSQIVLGVVVGRTGDKQGYRVSLGPLIAVLRDRDLMRYKTDKQPPSALYRHGDVLRVSTLLPITLTSITETVFLKPENSPQGAIVAIDPRTRHVKALVGGYDAEQFPFNRAYQAHRQAGSTFKPIVYAAGIESGRITPEMIFHNVPETYRLSRRKTWRPKNFSGRYDGKPYTVREALMKSINVIAVRILDKVGIPYAITFARKIGIRSPMSNDLTLVLGSASVSPLELVNAYATFASNGRYQDAILIRRIVDGQGQLRNLPQTPPRQVISVRVAKTITQMMIDVVQRGTGIAARKLGRPAAGKTGTSNKSRNNWFVGFTPQLVCGVWVGFDDRTPIRRGTGGGLAAPIWTAFMKDVLSGKPLLSFHLPPGHPKSTIQNRPGRKSAPRDLDSLLNQ